MLKDSLSWKLSIKVAMLLICITTYCCQPGSEDELGQKKGYLPSHMKPNILIIVVDTLRYDLTGLDGNSNLNMPNLLSLSRNGILFSNTYSTHDMTPSSHFSMLTGYTKKQPELDNPNYSIAYQMSLLGYDTFGISANGILSQKTMGILSGFESYTCLPEIWMNMPSEEKEKILKTIDLRIKHYGGRLNEFNRLHGFCSTERMLPLLKERLISSRQPFFGFVNFLDTHDPYFPDPEYYDKDAADNEIRPQGFDSDLRFRELPQELMNPDLIEDENQKQIVKQKIKAALGREWSLSLDLTADALKVYQMRYEAEIRDMDRQLNDLFQFMKNMNLFETTLIIVTSDHGESFGEDGFVTHWLDNKGNLESTRRVPLVFHFPPEYPFSTQEIEVFATIADIPPTIYDLVGIDWNVLARSAIGEFGKSLLPYFSSTLNYSIGVSFDPRQKINADKIKELTEKEKERLRSLGYIK